ncbi:MAG TPA: hypothetical protein VK661_03295 [Planctomycetota bacterium]|nr:hypothetical protein [Planctomycetota bacterium]
MFIVGHLGAKSWTTNHGSKEITRGKEKVKVCKIYNSITCDDHVTIGKEKASDFFGDKVFATPTHIFCEPSGKEISRRPGVINAADLVKEVDAAVAQVPGPRMSKDEYDTTLTSIQQGRDFVKKDEIKKAIDAFTKISKNANEKIHALGEQELKSLEDSGTARVEAAERLLESNEEQGKKELQKIAKEYPPLSCAKRAEEVLKLMAEKGR